MPLENEQQSATADPASEIDDAEFARGEQGTTVSEADLATQASSSAAPTPEPVPEPADPNVAAATRQREAAGEGNQQQSPGWQSVRDAATALGYQFSSDPADDNAALVELIRQASNSREADYYARLGRQIAPHAGKIQQYLQSQQQAPAQPERSEWDRPEFDPTWMQLVQRDEQSGVFLAKPGAPPDLADKVNAYAQWYERFQREPESYITHVARDLFRKEFQEQFAAVRQQTEQEQAVQEISRANAGWLYQTDQQGNPVRGADGRYLFSAPGVRYLQHVQSVSKMGVTDPRAQDYLARSMLLAETNQAQAAQQQAQAAKPAVPPLTRPNVNPIQTMPPQDRRGNPAATDPSTTGLSLAEAMRREFERAGLAESDFQFSEVA